MGKASERLGSLIHLENGDFAIAYAMKNGKFKTQSGYKSRESSEMGIIYTDKSMKIKNKEVI